MRDTNSTFERRKRDEGRMGVTENSADACAFRTPSLRSVAQAGPYGHSDAYGTLEEVVRHHLYPVAALQSYLEASAISFVSISEGDFDLMRDPIVVERIAAVNVRQSTGLNAAEAEKIIAFPQHDRHPQLVRARYKLYPSINSIHPPAARKFGPCGRCSIGSQCPNTMDSIFHKNQMKIKDTNSINDFMLTQ